VADEHSLDEVSVYL